MIHVTLNTGHHETVSDDIDQTVLRALEPLVKAGRGVVPGYQDHRVEILMPEVGAWLWTLYRGRDPLACCAFCSKAELAERLWAQLERMYVDVVTDGEMPEMPEVVPWLATVLLPPAAAYLQSMRWTADFDQCLAVALRKTYEKTPDPKAEARVRVAMMLERMKATPNVSKTIPLSDYPTVEDFNAILGGESVAGWTHAFHTAVNREVAKELKLHGFDALFVPVRSAELFPWLLKHGLPNTPANRAQFVSCKAIPGRPKPDPRDN